jgi:beta-mannosidase
MKTSMYFLILFVIFSITGCKKQEHMPDKISLNGEWLFKQITKEQWNPAMVPGCVHTDLYRNEMIKDPFFGTNI